MNRATILHLTDLHLGDDAPGSELGAYKEDFVELEERERRRGLIEQTLTQTSSSGTPPGPTPCETLDRASSTPIR